jgi:hypothetical protein
LDLRKKYKMLNVLSSPALWTFYGNLVIFCAFRITNGGTLWELAGRCARMLRDWRVLQRPEEAAVLDEWIQALERRRSSPAELHEIHFSARFEHMFGKSYICTYI